MESAFRNIRALIANGQFGQLNDIRFDKPQKFNWVKEVFEGINLADHPDATALLWTDGKAVQRYSFHDLSISGNKLLNFLRARGMQKGDVMLTQLSLQVINWHAVLAAIKGGFRKIPTATILGPSDIAYRFQRLMPKVVIADQENASKIEEAERSLNKKVAIKIIAEGERDGWVSLTEIARYDESAAAADTYADDPLFLFFTSGTTGLPKIVVHTHFSYPAGHLSTAAWIGLKHGDVHYNISQPGWAKFSWSSFFAPWNMGAAIFAFHSTERFDAVRTLQLMAAHDISTFCAPPTVLRLLIREDLRAYELKLRSCVAAGEPLNPEIIEAWKKGTGILIRDGYGQTESTCMVANLPDSTVKSGSMGMQLFMYDIVIADDEGNILADGEEGNICVRTEGARPNGIFIDYMDEPGRKKTVFKHGLYYTGDKAYKDEESYLWFVGRDDDVIKSSDYRIGPFEVESVLLEHEHILESAVVGSPHPIKGHEVKAFVILSGTALPSQALADDIFSHCRARMAPYKMPRSIEFVKELPKTISGKIRRVELRQLEAERQAGTREDAASVYKIGPVR